MKQGSGLTHMIPDGQMTMTLVVSSFCRSVPISEDSVLVGKRLKVEIPSKQIVVAIIVWFVIFLALQLAANGCYKTGM